MWLGLSVPFFSPFGPLQEQRLARVEQLEDTLAKLTCDHQKEVAKLKTVSSREKSQQDRQTKAHSKVHPQKCSWKVITLEALHRFCPSSLL